MAEPRFPVPKKTAMEVVGGLVMAFIVAIFWQAMTIPENSAKSVSWPDAILVGILVYMAFSLGRYNGWTDAAEKLEKLIDQLEKALEEASDERDSPYQTRFNLPL